MVVETGGGSVFILIFGWVRINLVREMREHIDGRILDDNFLLSFFFSILLLSMLLLFRAYSRSFYFTGVWDAMVGLVR